MKESRGNVGVGFCINRLSLFDHQGRHLFMGRPHRKFLDRVRVDVVMYFLSRVEDSLF